MATTPAPGVAAKAATIARAFASASAVGREHLVDDRDLRRMDREPSGEAVAARFLGVAPQPVEIAEVDIDRLDRRRLRGGGAEQAERAREPIGLGEPAIGVAVGLGAELGGRGPPVPRSCRSGGRSTP